MANADPRQVVKVLSQYYSTSELKSLCFDIGIDYEDLGGQGKSGKARELVQYAQRRGGLDKIVAYIQETRPQVNLTGNSTASASTSQTVTPPAQAPVYHIHGDYIEGDKSAGDKVDGDKISVGNISGSSGIAIGRGASATVNTGDTFNMSGDFRGANMNVKSTLKDVNQTISTLPQANESEKIVLQQLIAQLNETLQQVPADKTEEADAVAQFAETLVDTANNDKPNKMIMEITGEGLKKAAANLAGIVPDVAKIASSLVAGILALA